MPKRNPQLIADRNPTNFLRRSPRFLPENKISADHLGASKRSASKQTAAESFFTPPCSRIAKTQRNVSGALRGGGEKDSELKISVNSRRKSARLDNAAAFSCLDLQKQCVVEKRVTRSSTGGIKRVNYKGCEFNAISGKRDRIIKSLGRSSKGTKRPARLDDGALVRKDEEDMFPQKQYQIEKRLTSSLCRNKIVTKIGNSDQDWEEDSRERVMILSKDRKSKGGYDTLKKNMGDIEKRINRRSSDERKRGEGDTLEKNIGEIEKRVDRRSSDVRKHGGVDTLKKKIVEVEKSVNRRSSDERKHGGGDELSELYTNEKDAKDYGVALISCDKNGKRTQDEKSKRCQVGEGDVDHGWTKEQDLSLRRAYFVAKPTPQFWKEVARMVPGKSAKECFDRIHSDQATPSQPPTRSRSRKKELSPILFSPSKLLSPAETKGKKRVSKMRKTLAAQKTVRKLLQKQHTEDQDYEADLYSLLEPTSDPAPLNLQVGTPFASPAPNQGSSSAQRKQRSRLNSSQKGGFLSPPVLKQIKNKSLHEKYIDQLHCRDAKRKAAASRKARNVDENVSLLKPNLVKVAKDALVSDAQDAINRLRSLKSGMDCSNNDDDDSTCLSSDEDEDDDEFC